MAKILVIEDHELLRIQITHTLESRQHDVLGASDGQIGLQIALDQHPDLILCDVMMSSVNGFEVLQQLRQMPAMTATPFIFMSARSDREAMRYGMSLGADDFITKPFTTGELLDAVQLRLERHQLMVKEAERDLERTRQHLVHMITHELRTPLATINMAVEMIARHVDDIDASEMQRLLESLSNGSKRLTRVVDQMVLISQLQSGAISRAEIQRRGVSLALPEVVDAAMSMGRRFAARQNAIEFHMEPELEAARIISNPHALKYALAELICNALNFTDESAGIQVGVWQVNQTAYVCIRDNGPGIPPTEIDRAMELFQQIDRQRQEQQGMGLGLGLALHIIEAHDGTLALKSTPGEGTEAIVALPVAAGM